MTAASATATDDRRAWLALLRVAGLGPGRLLQLVTRFGSAAAVLAAGERGWRDAGVAETLVAGLRAPDWAGVEADLRWLAEPRRDLVVWDDPRYPARLKEIQLPPPALFACGRVELLASPQLAIVGARAASAQGREDARSFAAALAGAGLTITSGLALGIDGAAHRGALAVGGTTVAVCANGLDRVYPARHRELAHEIADRGLLVSEFAIGTPPRAEHFPRRNRIISGLALGVLVVEAAPASGSLITARLAAEQGREVFAIPGSIHHPLARGCHALIRDGAKLVETVGDVLEELGMATADAAALAGGAGERAPEDPLQRRVLEAVGFAPVAIDALLQRLDLPPPRLHQALLALELAGYLAAGPGDTYTRLRRGVN